MLAEARRGDDMPEGWGVEEIELLRRVLELRLQQDAAGFADSSPRTS